MNFKEFVRASLEAADSTQKVQDWQIRHYYNLWDLAIGKRLLYFLLLISYCFLQNAKFYIWTIGSICIGPGIPSGYTII